MPMPYQTSEISTMYGDFTSMLAQPNINHYIQYVRTWYVMIHAIDTAARNAKGYLKPVCKTIQSNQVIVTVNSLIKL